MPTVPILPPAPPTFSQLDLMLANGRLGRDPPSEAGVVKIGPDQRRPQGDGSVPPAVLSKRGLSPLLRTALSSTPE
jgi:hypothetical protein